MATLVLLTQKSGFKSESLFVCFSTATSALLSAQQQPIPPGTYRVSLAVTAPQDRRCETPESLALEVCHCDSRDACETYDPSTDTDILHGDRSWVRLGPAAIGLLLLGLLLLLGESRVPRRCPARGGGPLSHRPPCWPGDGGGRGQNRSLTAPRARPGAKTL